jgi:hypothetical protein
LRSDSSLRALGRAICECTDEDPCAQILCPFCAHRYRLWLAPEMLRLAASRAPAFVATILLTAVEGDDLRRVDVRLLHDRARKRLIRSGVQAAIGGTEASYDASDGRWTVHLHLLIFGKIDDLKPRIARAFKKDGLKRAALCEQLEDHVSQITYLQKFATYHRPGAPGFSGRGRAYPLKPRQIVELALWTEGRRFEDFLFALGLRRRGPRFVGERGFDVVLRGTSTWRRGDVATRAAKRPAQPTGGCEPRKNSVTSIPVPPLSFFRDTSLFLSKQHVDSRRQIPDDRSAIRSSCIRRVAARKRSPNWTAE